MIRTGVDRVRGLNPLIADGLLAVAIAALSLSSLTGGDAGLSRPGIDFREPDLLAVVLLLFMTLPVAVRRTAPAWALEDI